VGAEEGRGGGVPRPPPPRAQPVVLKPEALWGPEGDATMGRSVKSPTRKPWDRFRVDGQKNCENSQGKSFLAV